MEKEEKEIEKGFEVEKADISGFELTKLVYKSKDLANFLKENCGALTFANVKTTLANLCTFYNAEKNCIYPMINDIADETGLSARTVMRVIEFLHSSGLVLRQGSLNKDNRRNFYIFTGKFWDLVLADYEKFFGQKKVTRCHVNTQDRCHGVTYLKSPQVNQVEGDKPNFDTPINNSIKKITINNNVFSNKNCERVQTEFQESFRDVIERLSDFDWQHYKKLEGHQKREYLEGKRSEFLRADVDAQARESLREMRSDCVSPSDFGRDEALEFCCNMPAVGRRTSGFLALCQKWGFTSEDLGGGVSCAD